MADTDETETKKSIELFEKTISDIDSTNMLLHVDNSASTLYQLDNSFNMARVGIAAYGVQITAVDNENELLPTMEIKTRISNLQVRKKVRQFLMEKLKDYPETQLLRLHLLDMVMGILGIHFPMEKSL